jgi:hypothetical protein
MRCSIALARSESRNRQARAESVSTPFVRAYAANIKVLTDFQFMNTVGNLAVLTGLLDPQTEIGVLQRNAIPIAARGIDDLTVRDGTVGVDPASPTPTVSR